jgi:hypothetical protein
VRATPGGRARLAEALLPSLDERDAELDIAWGDEAERRSQELRSGKVTLRQAVSR